MRQNVLYNIISQYKKQQMSGFSSNNLSDKKKSFLWKKTKLTVDNKLLALLLAHASAVLSINKPINI